jgi:hypothetical protein
VNELKRRTQMIRKTTLWAALAGLAIASAAHAQTYPINNPTYIPQALVPTQAISAVGASTAFQLNGTPTLCFRVLGTFTGLVANLQVTEARAQPVTFVPTWTNTGVQLMGSNVAASVVQLQVNAAGIYCAEVAGMAQARLNVTAISTGTANVTFSAGPGSKYTATLNRQRATYSVVTTGLVVVATAPTDFLTVIGSATSVIRITHAECSGTSATAGYGNLVALIRSTANTLGTSLQLTPTPHDPTDATTAATAFSYTANPTTGTLAGSIRSARLPLPLNTTGNMAPVVGWDFGAQNRQATQEVVLRGVNSVFALNGGGTTLPGASAYNCSIEYTEE